MSRAKKHIASSFAGSKAGRSVITKALGHDGEVLITAIKATVDRHDGHSKAKETKGNIYKLALKFKLMRDNKKLDEEKFKKSQEPIYDLTRILLPALDPTNKPEDKSIIGKIIERITITNKNTHAIMDPNMTDKNIKMLESTLLTISNESILTALIFDDAYIEEKKQIYNSLHPIMIIQDEQYALDCNTSLTKEKFSEQYDKEIKMCQSFWNNLKNKDQVGMSIINRLVENHGEYYNLLEHCIDGDDVMKQHARVVDSLDLIISGLNDWPKLKETLIKVGKDHNSWAPGAEKELYAHLLQAFHLGMSKITKEYVEKKEIREDYHIIFRLVLHILQKYY